MSINLVLRIECDLKSFYGEREFPIFEWTLCDFRSYVEQLLQIKKRNLVILLHSLELGKELDNYLLCNIKNLNNNDTITIDSHDHVEDIDSVNRLPDRYRMSDEAYGQRKGTLKDYFVQNKLGKYSDPSGSSTALINNKKEFKRKLRESNRMKLKQIHIGMRVKIMEPMISTRYGEVAYIGILRGIRDVFIGVRYDVACGDSNGSDGFIRYFDAKQKHASFVRPEYIEIV